MLDFIRSAKPVCFINQDCDDPTTQTAWDAGAPWDNGIFWS